MTQTWRPSLPMRIISGAFAVTLTVAMLGELVWLQSSGYSTAIRLIKGLVFCCCGNAYAIPVLRASVTLTDDEVIIQNVFRSHRVQMGDLLAAKVSGPGLTISRKDGSGVVVGGVGRTEIAGWLGRRTWGDRAAEAINIAISRHQQTSLPPA